MAAVETPGVRDSRRRTLAIATLIAVAVHLPFTPLPFVLRFLAAYLTRGDTSWDYEDDRVIIPISLLDDPTRQPEPSPAPPAEATQTPTEPARPKHAAEKVQRDAGASEVADAGATDDQAGDAPPHRAPRASDGASEGGRSEAAVVDGGTDGGTGLKDTLSLVGNLRRAVEGKPNVTIVFWFSTIREHPLGPLVGGLLACNPQWHEFVGDIIDPLADLDGVMLYGPRMAETSKVTVIAQHRLPEHKVKDVMGVLASTAKANGSGGVFPTGQPGTLAVRFHADRADRIALTHPPNVIIVTPPETFERFRDMTGPLSLPPGQGRAMSLTMVNPWRPLRGLGLRLPETLTEIRVNISAAPDGGVNADIEFDDQSPALARQHAAEVTDQARAIGGAFLDDLEFVPQDNRLRGHTHLSRIGSTFALGFARASICPAGTFDGGGAR